MATLKNVAYANKDLVTAYGTFHFSETGETEIDESAGKKLATIQGFSLIGESEEPEQENDSVEQDAEEDEQGENPTPEEENAQETEENGEPESEEPDESDDDDEDEEPDDSENPDENADEDAEEDEITEDKLQEYTVAELKKYAKDNGIDIGTAYKKQDIINIIIGK